MNYFARLVSISAASLALTSVALADGYQFQFNNAFSGTAPASTNGPWMNARFQDTLPGTVQLTVSNLSLVGSENVDQLYFNLAPNLNPLTLHFTYVSGSGGFDLPTITEGINEFKADGDGKYDVLFTFSHNGNDKHQFTAGEYFTYTISGIAGLTAQDFGYLSFPDGGVGPFYAAAHVQRIGTGSLSGWISADLMAPINPIPEPGSGLLLGLAASLWLGYRLLNRCAKTSTALKFKPIPARPRQIHRRRPASRR